MSTDIRYAGYPFAIVREKPEPHSKPIKQTIWGDWVRITQADTGSGFCGVHVRNVDGFIAATDLQSERLVSR